MKLASIPRTTIIPSRNYFCFRRSFKAIKFLSDENKSLPIINSSIITYIQAKTIATYLQICHQHAQEATQQGNKTSPRRLANEPPNIASWFERRDVMHITINRINFSGLDRTSSNFLRIPYNLGTNVHYLKICKQVSSQNDYDGT